MDIRHNTHDMKPERVAVRFLVEEFVHVADDDASERAVVALQKRAARELLPERLPGARKTYTPAQLALLGLSRVVFQQLRRDVRDWLYALAVDPRMGQTRTLEGPLRLSLVAAPGKSGRLGAPIVEGKPLDVCWFYIVYLVSRIGIDRIGICRAPKSKKDPGQRDAELAGTTEPCDRLFIRRGRVKEFCSVRCQNRVATQRARGVIS